MRLITLLAWSLLIVVFGVQNGESRGGRGGAKYGLFMENVSFVEKGKRVSGKLCVIPYKDKEGVPGSRWMLLRSDSYFARDLGDVNPGFAIVNNVKASPDMKYLAVETVGEGQGIIDILDLQKLIAGEKVESLFKISPHPGLVHIVQWKRGLLMFSSDFFLEQKNNEVQARHTNLSLVQKEYYYLDMRSQKVIPHNPLLKRPVTYYSRMLWHRKASVRLNAAIALRTLHAKSALPQLKSVFRRERDARVKENLKVTIDYLEGK